MEAIISFILLIFSFFVVRLTWLYRAIVGLLVFLYAIFLGLYFVADTFTGKGLDESVLYHLVYGLDGAGVGSDVTPFLVGIFFGVLAILLPFASRLTAKITIFKNQKIAWGVFFVVFFMAFLIHPINKNMASMLALRLSGQHLMPEYHTPNPVKITQNTKNIVYIYLESFEQIFTDESIFPNLAPNLNALKKEALVFDNIEQTFGTSWTIGGMVGSQCGIPLVTSGGSYGMTQFLPRAICLGDILKKHNYQLVSMGGADANFAGKGHFYRTHGFDTILGKKELFGENFDPKTMNEWGAQDSIFLPKFLKEYDRLAKSGKNFFIEFITLDTHGEMGTVAPICQKKLYDPKNPNSILNAYHCSDHLIGDLIAKIRNHPNFANTLIVIGSDHYAMKNNNQYATLSQNQAKRRNLFMILGNDIKPKIINKPGTTLDIAPTILSLSGFHSENFALGVNLFSQKESKKNDYIQKYRWFFESFWQYPNLKNGIEFDALKNVAILWESQIKLPVLFFLWDKKNLEKIEWDDDGSVANLRAKMPKSSLLLYREWDYFKSEYKDSSGNIHTKILNEKAKIVLQ